MSTNVEQPSKSQTEVRTQQHLEAMRKSKLAVKVKSAGERFKAYRPTGVTVKYAQNKVGIMPDIEVVLQEIAEQAGIDLSKPASMSAFLEAIVTDVYVNPYSDKQSFDGHIDAGGTLIPRSIVKQVIQPYVGTMYRRFARALAPIVVEVMSDNYEVFGEILDMRCTELNLSTRAEAVYQFDGGDAIPVRDREAARVTAQRKLVALTNNNNAVKAYTFDNCAANVKI